MTLAYVPSQGPQHLEAAYHTLISWATPLGLMDRAPQLLTLYHDSFKVTAAHKVRMSACMVLDSPITPTGAIGMTVIEPGSCIVGRFEIGLKDFEIAWTALFTWMNDHGHTKADLPPFEMYHNTVQEHPEQPLRVDFYIPIV